VKRPAIVVLSARGAASFTPGQRRRLARAGRVRFVTAPRHLSPGALVRALDGAVIAGLTPRATPPLDRTLLARLPALRAVAVPTTGCDWIDLDVLRSARVRVLALPGFSTVSAAEFTVGLVLALARRIVPAAARGRAGAGGSGLKGIELAGKTLGVVGLGAIGTEVARLGRAFGMRVIATDPRGRARTPLASLLSASDVVTLHVPLDDSTRGLLGARELARMRPGSLLVNTARPALVETKALARALASRRPAAYAVDLGYLAGRERRDLARLPGVLAVPHVSWYTREAIEREMEGWTRNLIALATRR
jgi:phosphoglycerate dehydrogenase-like enzyme